MKKLCLALITITISVFSSIISFAGQWQQDTTGWFYQNDDGSYMNNGWNWIDGKCYYFTADGYCLQNTQTPDGYTVDENGAWIIDGVIQSQNQTQSQSQTAGTYTMGKLTFSTPDGFLFYKQDDSSYCMFYSYDNQTYLFVHCFDVGVDLSTISTEEEISAFLDKIALGRTDTDVLTASKQLLSGSWNFYRYPTAGIFDIPGTLNAYLRMDGSYVQHIMIAGDLTNMDTDEIVNSMLK